MSSVFINCIINTKFGVYAMISFRGNLETTWKKFEKIIVFKITILRWNCENQ